MILRIKGAIPPGGGEWYISYDTETRLTTFKVIAAEPGDHFTLQASAQLLGEMLDGTYSHAPGSLWAILAATLVHIPRHELE